MKPSPSRETQRDIEWELLRLLCSSALTADQRSETLALLADFSFSDPIRQVIFYEVEKIGWNRDNALREELPARLTRRGFPDVDFDDLFLPPTLPAKPATELARSLLTAVRRP